MTDSEFQALMAKRGYTLLGNSTHHLHAAFRVLGFDADDFCVLLDATGAVPWCRKAHRWKRIETALRRFEFAERKAAAEKRLAELAAQIREAEQELEACEMEGRLYLKA